MSFSFVSGIATLTNTNVANIFVNLGQDVQIATVNGNQYRSDYLGMLRYTGTGASNYLYAGLNDNPPVYLINRPTNNKVFIEIHSNTGSFTTNYSPVSGAYTLSMSFELQE